VKSAWGEADIAASRVVHRAHASLPTARRSRPTRSTCSSSSRRATTTLGARRRPPRAHRALSDALRAARGPKFSPDGRFVYFASRDGWIAKYDLWSLSLVAEVRAGLNTRNAAVSSDGRS
jgi:hypothetical protein